MSHDINIVEGRAAFASAKEVAWHGLGTIVKEAMTSEEAIKLAYLDYEVNKYPIFGLHTNDVDTEYIPADGFCATVREDTKDVLGVVSDKYQVFQNTECFDFFDQLVGEKEAMFETAGALGKGERVFITAKFPDHISVNGNDNIEQYLLLFNSHDGKSGIKVMFTDVRVVCNNTLQAALRHNSGALSFKHSKNVKQKMEQANKILKVKNKLKQEMSEIYNSMANSYVNSDMVKNAILYNLLTKEELKGVAESGTVRGVDPSTGKTYLSTRKINLVNKVYKYYKKGIGQDTETTRGTVFGFYNGITGYYQNNKVYRDSETKFLSIAERSVKETTNKAFDISLELIKNPDKYETINTITYGLV